MVPSRACGTMLRTDVGMTVRSDVAATIRKGASGNAMSSAGTMTTPPPRPKSTDVTPAATPITKTTAWIGVGVRPSVSAPLAPAAGVVTRRQPVRTSRAAKPRRSGRSPTRASTWPPINEPVSVPAVSTAATIHATLLASTARVEMTPTVEMTSTAASDVPTGSLKGRPTAIMSRGTMMAPPPIPRKLVAAPAPRPMAGTRRRQRLIIDAWVNGLPGLLAETRFQGGTAQSFP